MDLFRATIRIFRSIPVTSKEKELLDAPLLKRCIEEGFLVSPELVHNYGEIEELIILISEEIGVNGKQVNQTFHKSWKKVKDSPIEQLILEQITHYFTTYGFERYGVFSHDSVYIPAETLTIPDLDVKGFTFITINGITKEELKIKTLEMLYSGIALNESTIKDIVDIAKFVGLSEEEVNNVRNKEVKIALFDGYHIIPEDPIEFLRYIVFKITKKTLLIKDLQTFDTIRINLGGSPSKKNRFAYQIIKRTDLNPDEIIALFNDYGDKYGFERLAEIFYRFKPLFLALRANRQLKKHVNKIRKLAVEHHKPMKDDYLNMVTEKLKKGIAVDESEFDSYLNKANLFRKIRLLYALNYRSGNSESILYRIRNGKGYATSFMFKNRSSAKSIYDVVLRSISADLKKGLEGKTVFIPDYVSYALPSTEKQFTDKFPSGTYISVPNDMVLGVHWVNVNGQRVDLDFSMINAKIGKMGWDGGYRTPDATILFSGDMTNAPEPNGASEMFYVTRQSDGEFIVMLNNYNSGDKLEVPYKIIIAKEQVTHLNHNYTVNPNNIVQVANARIKGQQKIVGLLIINQKECRFYFADTSIGTSISAYGNDYTHHSKNYLVDFYTNSVNLKEVLESSGVKFVDKPENCDIDLSPEKLEKNMIINLLQKQVGGSQS